MRSSEIQRLLPGVFQRTLGAGGTPLAAALEVMSALHAPAEAVLGDLDAAFDPRRTPERFVPLLATWLDLEVALGAEPGRLRELTAAAFELAQWRGTARGLVRFLEIATGVAGFQVDERVRPFHVRISVPPDAAPLRPLVERIVEREKPASVTYELTVLSRPQSPGG